MLRFIRIKLYCKGPASFQSTHFNSNASKAVPVFLSAKQRPFVAGLLISITNLELLYVKESTSLKKGSCKLLLVSRFFSQDLLFLTRRLKKKKDVKSC